ncbi:hypothetical protein QFC20_006516 [Naganishia adeliensis]|uniref:Uncharacterized protein n=1 Tax=Naganishia adeliensis TaxID=92952 RepID=A0ACC2VAK7_9TREE|nr:hypothetical protein QFC20_006516 [Naganishia adeliensis]
MVNSGAAAIEMAEIVDAGAGRHEWNNMQAGRVAGDHVITVHLLKAEKKVIPAHGFGNARFGSSTCFLRLGYVDWHLNLVLSLPMAKVFVNKLKAEAKIRMRMLMNRLHLTISGQTSHDDYHALLAQLHDLYASIAIDQHLIVPARSDPPEIAQCVAEVRLRD